MRANFQCHTGLTLIRCCALACAVASLVAGCEATRGPAFQVAKQDQEVFTQPLREPKLVHSGEETLLAGSESNDQQEGIEVYKTPQISVRQAEVQAKDTVMPGLVGKKVDRLTFNNMPIGAFINEVFGNQLGLNFVIEPSIKNASDFVTLRISNAIDQSALFELALETLNSYGVATALRGDILSFSYSEDAAEGVMPLLATGVTLPEVPSKNRPIFQYYVLESVDTRQVRSWLLKLFNKRDLEIEEDIERNALVLKGLPAAVRRGIAAVRLFDQPSMVGMHSRIIRPNLSSVAELATSLEGILKAEGYSVRQRDGKTAIRLLPLESVEQLVVFSHSEEVLDHVVEWAQTIESEHHQRVELGIFSYKVQNAKADHIVNILNGLGVANSVSSSSSSSDQKSSNSGNNRAEQGYKSTGRYAVDEQLNTILYSGSGRDWLQVLPVIKSLDRPAPSVLVEVILAEISLNDSEKSGVEWLMNAGLGDYDLDFGTIDALGLSNGGFNLSVSSPAGVKAVVNLMYSNSQSTIRSRPRLMVKSGGQASIDVGDEVPIVTQSSQGTQDPNAPLVQTISYRNTGVLLEIKPTVHASGFIDIDVSQELSEAVNTTSSSIDSPTITNRRMVTTVTLRDGGAVLLGGLISSTQGEGETGVPILGQLPGIGNLFKSKTAEAKRTELMIMIIPYVLNSPEEAETLTDELQLNRMSELSL